MQCKQCNTPMDLIGEETSQHSLSQRYRCSVCRSERLCSKLVLNDQPFSLDPFVNYSASKSIQTKANDEQNFQLKQVEYK